MSIFTTVNGPQCGSMPNASALVQYADAYTAMLSNLQAHIADNVPEHNPHGVKSWVEGINSSLVEEIDTVNSTLAGRIDALAGDVTNYEQDVSVLSSHVDIVNAALFAEMDNIQNNINALNTTVQGFPAGIYEHTDAYTDQKVQDLADTFNDGSVQEFKADVLTAKDYIAGKVHVDSLIDFVKWTKVTAQFAGTGTPIDTDTDGIYIIGEIATDWEGEDKPSADGSKYKHGTAFVKYENTHPFDAMVNFTMSKNDNDMHGAIDVLVSKAEDNTWNNLKFHLVYTTDSNSTQHVYLAISARNLGTGGEYPTLEFYIAGTDILPNVASGIVHGTATARVPDNRGSVFATSVVSASELIVQEATIDELSKLPEIPDGNIATRSDIKVTLPIGAGIRWYDIDNIPYGWVLAGSTITEEEYPELYAMYGANLPTEDYTIFLGKYVMEA